MSSEQHHVGAVWGLSWGHIAILGLYRGAGLGKFTEESSIYLDASWRKP